MLQNVVVWAFFVSTHHLLTDIKNMRIPLIIRETANLIKNFLKKNKRREKLNKEKHMWEYLHQLPLLTFEIFHTPPL